MKENGCNPKHNIAAVMMYCTNDYKFVGHAIDSVSRFCNQVIVTVVDHFFDGGPENRELLQRSYGENPTARFVEIEYDAETTRRHGPMIWYCTSRLVGLQHVDPDIEYILFIDSDEVIEAARFARWLDRFNYRDFDYLYLQNYWYFREARFRADTVEDSVVLVRHKAIDRRHVFTQYDRLGFLQLGNGRKAIPGSDGRPMIHHYSWVRSKEEMLHKVRTSGHWNDRNWEALVEKEFEHEFLGTDFVHGYSYSIVAPYVDLV